MIGYIMNYVQKETELRAKLCELEAKIARLENKIDHNTALQAHLIEVNGRPKPSKLKRIIKILKEDL